MPQRLTETAGEQGQPLDIHGKRLIDCYDQLAGILRNRLGQNHAHFFAQPRTQPSGAIAWYTPLAGSVVRADALPPEERQRLQERVQRILGDVLGVATDIQSEGAAGKMIADMLRAAAQLAPGAPLFSVDGKPVAVLWGHRDPAAAAPDAPAVSRTAPAATAPGGTISRPVSAEPVPPPSSPVAVSANSQAQASPSNIAVAKDPALRKRQRARLLAACAGVIVLLALLWGLREFAMRDRATDASAGDVDTQIAEAEGRNRMLEAEIAKVKGKGKAPAVKCVPEPKKK